MLPPRHFLLALLLALPLRAEISPADFDKGMQACLAKEGNVEKLMEVLTKFNMKKQEAARKSEAQDEQNRVEAQFKNPVKIDVGKAPVKGNASAKVTTSRTAKTPFGSVRCGLS